MFLSPLADLADCNSTDRTEPLGELNGVSSG